jgi:hypothetical protein
MKYRPHPHVVVTLVLTLGISVPVSVMGGTPSKPTNAPETVVDSGSFGILVNGHRVATEKFRMEQHSSSNVVSAELSYDDARVKAVQNADMEVEANGSLKKYTWKESAPGKAEITVEPQDANFLISHMTENDKPPTENTHPLSPLTTILDDNFYSQMQVLAWKYLALSCGPVAADGKSTCNYKPLKFPVLNPHQQASQVVMVDFIGRHAMKWQKTYGSYNVFKLTSESGNFELWLNDKNQLVRVLDKVDNTEVIRD